MDQHLYKYLVLHKHLCIPQVGSFLVRREPAHVNSGKLYGPKPVIYFSEGDKPSSDKFFFNFLATEMGIDEVAAIKQFHDFSYRFRNDMAENKPAILNGVGSLVKKEDGSFHFEPANDLSELIPVVAIPETTIIINQRDATQTEETEETEELIEEPETERWWFAAFLLFILGAGALMYYYL
jgi:hypothetical protein